MDKPQNYYHELFKYTFNSDNKKYIHKYDTIITQNSNNLNELIQNSYIDEKKNKIVISPLPDYCESQNKILTNNKDKIVIGVIGCLSKIKGFYIFDYIVRYFKIHKLYSAVPLKFVFFTVGLIGIFKSTILF